MRHGVQYFVARDASSLVVRQSHGQFLDWCEANKGKYMIQKTRKRIAYMQTETISDEVANMVKDGSAVSVEELLNANVGV